MTDPNSTQEKMASFGASAGESLNAALDEARPAVDRMRHRLKDELQSLSESGKDAYAEAKHKLEREARHVRVTTEHYIQQAPISSVLVAAGVGAVAALGVCWLMRSRQH